jgi:hypothetical protein
MANQRHKKIIKRAKGFRGRANRCFTVAFHRVLKAKQYAYRDRKVCFLRLFFIWLIVEHFFITNITGKEEGHEEALDNACKCSK